MGIIFQKRRIAGSVPIDSRPTSGSNNAASSGGTYIDLKNRVLNSDYGIVVDGNKSASSASTGQYVILQNSTISGKSDGLYKAAKAIPADTVIDGTYLTATTNGGLNDLRSALDAAKPTLLWTNPSPQSSFSSQTVAINLSAYAYVIVEVGIDVLAMTSKNVFIVPTDGSNIQMSTIRSVTGTVPYSVSRNTKVEYRSTGIFFETGKTRAFDATSSADNNNVMVPTKIWGVQE